MKSTKHGAHPDYRDYSYRNGFEEYSMKHLKFLAAFVALALVASTARADFQAYNATTGTTGNQSFGGSVGLDTSVVSNTVINYLGVYDSGLDGLAAAHVVNLYLRTSQTTGTLVGTVTVASGVSAGLINGYRIAKLGAPLTLLAGNVYTVVVDNMTADLMYNTGTAGSPPGPLNTNGGTLAFNATNANGLYGRYDFTSGAIFPTISDTLSFNFPYGAGTFGFVIPEPSSVALLGIGLSGMIALSHRKRLLKAKADVSA